MDPLSEVLSVLKPRSYLSGGFRVAHGESIRFPAYEGIKCYAVLEGECWLQLEGEESPVLVQAGDCFLLPKGRPFVLTMDRGAEPVDFKDFLAELRKGERLSCGGGCHFAGGHFLLTGGPSEILLGILPPVVHLQKDKDKEAIRWSLQRLKEELDYPQPGGALVAQQLAYMMLVQALRLHLTDRERCGVGWLFALADEQMHAAIACMHEEPGRAWTLQELATRVGMSRTVFAERFKMTAGMTPMEYLARWRMLVAGDRLRSTRDSIAGIAASLGYESESAFGKAFKRVMGCSPRQYGRAEN